MGLMTNDTKTNSNKQNNKTYDNSKAIYIKIDGQPKSAQFNPRKAYENIITNEQVLKIITTGDITNTEANKEGYVNFMLSKNDKSFGFLNFLANDLNADSSEDAITEELFKVEAKLSKVTLADISRPMTEAEAMAALDAL